MTSFAAPPLFARLATAERVLVAGAGGGFDLYAGLPIALALGAQGKDVHLANLSFTYLGGTDAAFPFPHVAEVTPRTAGEERYFPERTLARWLERRGLPSTIYAFEKVGARPLAAAYRWLVERLQLDAIVMVDGGTDLLMRGDEAGLGTPEEDMTSLFAVASTRAPIKVAACLGFGIDAFHGVCHAHFLENVAALTRAGGYLGALSVPADSDEGAAFIEAVADSIAHTPSRPSIVNGQIAAAVRGDFGDVQFTRRTEGSELFVNPLMAIYFSFEVDALAQHSLYLPLLERTETIFEVSAVIEAFHGAAVTRARRAIPH